MAGHGITAQDLMDADDPRSTGAAAFPRSQVSLTPGAIFQAQQAQIHDLQALIIQQASSFSHLVEVFANATRTPYYRPEIRPPKAFAGKREKLREFLSKVGQQFAINPEAFPEDKDKTLYAGSALVGPVQSWYDHIFEAYSTGIKEKKPLPEEYQSYTKFEEKLTAMFGDPNERATHAGILMELKQTGSAMAYTAKFRISMHFMPWNDSAFYYTYRQGLKEDVKDCLALEYPQPETLEDLIKTAQRIDRVVSERAKATSPARLSKVASRTYSHPPAPARLMNLGDDKTNNDALG